MNTTSDGMENNDLLTYEEVAKRLGVAEQTVRNKVSQDEWKIPRVQLGYRTVRFKREDVEQFIEDNRGY